MKRKVILSLFIFALPIVSRGQERLSLNEAVQRAIAARPSLQAEAERIPAAEGARTQAGLRPNLEFQYQNENLRPGQTYGRDVDTLALISQPLDILGKRRTRIEAADRAVASARADLELAKWRVAQRVKFAYWTARGPQEIRDTLKASADAFQSTVDFHAARFSAGAIAEQDLLRVQLEHERLRLAAESAAIDADRAVADLLKEMGRSGRRSLESLNARLGSS